MFTCEVEYRGGIWPQMTWSWSDTRQSIDDFIDESVFRERKKRSILVTPDGRIDGRTINCRTHFNAPEYPGMGYATNAPTYKYDYAFPLVVNCE